LTENKVAVSIITGDKYKEEEIEKLLKSLEPHFHGVFVNYNGDNEELDWQKFTNLPVVWKKFKWEDDFALARNQALSLIPVDEFDWWMWIDTDDIFVAEEGALQEIFDSLDEYTEGIFLRYAYAVEPETNIVVVEQWRERIMSTKADWRWVFPIHEVCKSVSGAQFAKRDQAFIEHQRKSGEERGARDRNRRIITKALKENPDEPRFHFYFAGEAMAEADTLPPGLERNANIETAIMEYRKFREIINDLSDDVYLATCRIAELNRMKRDYSAALEADLECIAIYPDWPDGYVGAAKSCLELADWPRMKAFADMATKCSKPSTAASIEPMMASFTPLFLRAIANEELGNIDQALDDYKAAQKHWSPTSGDLEKKIEFLENLIKDKPGEERWHLRNKLRGTKKEKSICFFTQPIPDIWHPVTLEQNGAGGAETCIMKLAPMFQADGWRTVVFGTPGSYRGVHEGVEYWNSEEFLPTEEFTVFVSSRSYVPFEHNLRSKANFLWLHDVNIGNVDVNTINKADAVFGLTNWHAEHIQKLYKLNKNKIKVVPNGVDFSRFPVENWKEKNKKRVIYSSSPDRGLDILLSLWPLVKQRYPDIELHIYYGWDIIDKIIEVNSKRSPHASHLLQFKKKCLYQIQSLGGEEGGVFQHGRINQNDLAKEMASSEIWAYPTNFMETFCITAVEMQAAGVIPVTSGLAALNEVVYPKYEKIKGWPQNADYQRRWLELFAYSYEADSWKDEFREEAREFVQKFSWENSYEVWNNIIKEYV
jgi:glycosyltransferase involved in cell wall biosynthesis/tetratricopeptide (TPR) repeat protein